MSHFHAGCRGCEQSAAATSKLSNCFDHKRSRINATFGASRCSFRAAPHASQQQARGEQLASEGQFLLLGLCQSEFTDSCRQTARFPPAEVHRQRTAERAERSPSTICRASALWHALAQCCCAGLLRIDLLAKRGAATAQSLLPQERQTARSGTLEP